MYLIVLRAEVGKSKIMMNSLSQIKFIKRLCGTDIELYKRVCLSHFDNSIARCIKSC